MKPKCRSIAAKHLLRRISDDGVEPWTREPASGRVEEDLGKLELPMKQLARRRDLVDARGQAFRCESWQRAAPCQDLVGQRVEGCRRNHVTVDRQPRRAPDIGDAFP